MIACVTLLALAMHAVPMPASAQDIQDIDKRILQFMDTGNYGAALIEAQKFEAAVKAQRGTDHRDYVLALLQPRQRLRYGMVSTWRRGRVCGLLEVISPLISANQIVTNGLGSTKRRTDL